MDYEIVNLTLEEIDNNIIERVINATTKKLNVKNSTLSIVLVDNEKIHEINKKYRKVDRPTDVISFAFMDEKINPNSSFTDLGEIYISLEQAHIQADEYGHDFTRELAFLTVHGLLHLLGYDHIEKQDEEVMFKLQDEILEILKIER